MDIFNFDDYKLYIQTLVKSMPKRGRGEYRRISSSLGLHTTMTSQIFKGDKHLSPEQGILLAEYFGLSDLEAEYLLTLVTRDRAGNHKLKKFYEAKLSRLKSKSKDLVNRLPRDLVLSDPEKAIFYSTWHYPAIQLATFLESHDNINTIASYFSLPKAVVREVLDFLLKTGMCVKEEDKIKMGVTKTHLESSSPLVVKHHMNWRMKAMERHSILTDSEIAYSGPMALSKGDMLFLREEIIKFIQKTIKLVESSKPEKMACLNIDWVNI